MQTETKFSLRVMRFNSVNLILGEHMNKSELIDALSEETTFSKKDIAKVLAAQSADSFNGLIYADGGYLS